MRRPRTIAQHATQKARLVEEFAKLDAQIAAWKPAILRHEKIRSLILDWYRDVPPEEEIIVPGVTCDVLVSARDKLRSVTLDGRKKLYKRWGALDYIQKSLVLLKSLPDPDDKKAEYTTAALSGPRHLHVIEKASEPAA